MTKKLFTVLAVSVFIVAAFALAGCPSTVSDSDSGTPETDGGDTKVCKKTEDCVKYGTNYTCVSGKCESKVDFKCTDNTSCIEQFGDTAPCCDTAQKCQAVSSACPLCTSNDACKPDKVCKDFKCILLDNCANNEECPVGFTCNLASKKCECVDNATCADWPDNKTYCNPTTKTCTQAPSCDPVCDDTCKECRDGVCIYKAGYQCCTEKDCPGAEDTCENHTCKSPGCFDDCAGDEQKCIDWCGDSMWFCDTSNLCSLAQCKNDADCTTGSSPICPFKGTCDLVNHSCSCTEPLAACSQCDPNNDSCDQTAAIPLSCTGVVNVTPPTYYCTHSCVFDIQHIFMNPGCADVGQGLTHQCSTSDYTTWFCKC